MTSTRAASPCASGRRRGHSPFLQVSLFGLALALLLTSCGSPAGPPTVPCTQTTAFQGGIQVPPNTRHVQSFTTPATGALDVTVDWTSASNIMNVVLTQAPCTTEQLAASGCNVLFSAWSPPKPLRVSTSLLPSGTYVLYVGNPNPAAESITAQVLLSSAGCPAP